MSLLPFSLDTVVLPRLPPPPFFICIVLICCNLMFAFSCVLKKSPSPYILFSMWFISNPKLIMFCLLCWWSHAPPMNEHNLHHLCPHWRERLFDKWQWKTIKIKSKQNQYLCRILQLHLQLRCRPTVSIGLDSFCRDCDYDHRFYIFFLFLFV